MEPALSRPIRERAALRGRGIRVAQSPGTHSLLTARRPTRLSTSLPPREPHPVTSLAQAIENHRNICAVRGYCGPFINQAFYGRFTDPIWHGFGECVVCCSTSLIAREEEKRRQREAESPDVALPSP